MGSQADRNIIPSKCSVVAPDEFGIRSTCQLLLVKSSYLSELYLADARHHSVNLKKWKQSKQLRQIADPR